MSTKENSVEEIVRQAFGDLGKQTTIHAKVRSSETDFARLGREFWRSVTSKVASREAQSTARVAEPAVKTQPLGDLISMGLRNHDSGFMALIPVRKAGKKNG